MALWAGTSLNTNVLSSSVSKWFDKNFVPMVVKNNGLLHLMRKADGNAAPTTPGMSGRFRKGSISGNSLTVRLLGSLGSFSVVADADQGDLLSAATFSGENARWGAARFDWTQLYRKVPFYESEIRMIRGDEARTMSFMDDKLKEVVYSWEKTLGDAINSANAPSTSAIGGWRYAVDDSATYDAYGTITRSDSGNADFRSYVKSATGGNLVLEDITDVVLEILKAGGKPDIGVCGKTPYKKLEQELRGYVMSASPNWDGFTGQRTGQFMGVSFVFDHRGDDTSLGILDSGSWALYTDEDGVGQAGLQEVGGVYKAVRYMLPLHMTTQFVCVAPSWNGKVTSITG